MARPKRIFDLVANLRRTGRRGFRDYLRFRLSAARRVLLKRRRELPETTTLTVEELRQLRKKRILFLLPVAERGGGANVVLTESRRLRDFGIDVWLGNLSENREAFESMLSADDVPVVYLRKYSHAVALATEFDAMVATAWKSTDSLRSLCELQRPPTLGYYIQDYEPYFYPVDSLDHRDSRASYHFSHSLKLFTKTLWNQQEVSRHEGVAPTIVGPSFDNSIFNLNGRVERRDIIRICAMVRPRTPRRSPELTMRVLKRLQHRFAARVRITIFGCDRSELERADLERNFIFEHAGVLDSYGMAQLLKESDLFIDLSSFQAMGLTAMEAMACGAVVIGPSRGGLVEIINHNVSGLLTNTDDEDESFAAAESLVENESRIDRLRSGFPDLTRYFPEHAAQRIARLMLLEQCAAATTRH